MPFIVFARFTRSGSLSTATAHPSGIETNLYRSGNNFWLQGNSEQTENYGVKLKKMLNPRIVYTPYVRVNMEHASLKRLKGFISDSTAVNMGDPSSMTDQGMTRNAIYRIEIVDRDPHQRATSA